MQNRIIGIVGPKGSGKTHLAAEFFRRQDRAVVFNVAFDEAYYTGATDITDDIVHAIRKMEQEQFRIVLESDQLIPMGHGGLRYLDLDPLLDAAYKGGNMTAFLDEAHQICSPWAATFGTLKLIRLGRHQQVSIVWVSQRFSGVHRELTYNTDEFYFFRIHEPLDLDAIAKRCGGATADQVMRLRRLTEFEGKTEPGESLRWTAEDQ